MNDLLLLFCNHNFTNIEDKMSRQRVLDMNEEMDDQIQRIKQMNRTAN